MKMVAYIRVSTDRQAEEGMGLAIQEAAIREWARAAGHRIVAVARDEGASGSNGLDTRLGLADALELIRSGTAGGLVVYRLDRLARDLVLQEQLLAEIRRMGAELFSTSAAEAGYLADDPDDPSRALIRQVLGAVSEYERKMIALRLRAGRRKKQDGGGYIGGRAPFGYRVEGRQLVVDEEEQRAVNRMVALRIAGNSTRRIAVTLRSEGFRARRDVWHARSVGRILARSVGICD